MQTHHYMLLLVVLIVGYVLGILWTVPATLVGLKAS